MSHDPSLESEASKHAAGAQIIADGLCEVLRGIEYSQGSQSIPNLQTLFDILLEHITESIPEEKARDIISAKVNLSARPGGYSFKDLSNMRWAADRAMNDFCAVDDELVRSENRLRAIRKGV